MTYPDESKPSRTPDRNDGRRLRFCSGKLWLSALMLALPAFAALPAAARDKPERIQERQEERRPQPPPPSQSSAPVQEPPPPPPQEAQPAERESSPPERESSPPEHESAAPEREPEAPTRPSAPRRTTHIVDRTDRDRSTRPNDTNVVDPWRGSDWPDVDGEDDDDDYDDNESDGRDHEDRRDIHGGREPEGSDGHRGRNRHHDHPPRHCGNSRYGGYPSGECFPWTWPWWPTVEVESDLPATDGWGALDLDVAPERAEIYLDGQYVGIADEYDGFPTYLWLERGKYDLAIYLEGYETVFGQVIIFPGVVIDIEDRLRTGTSIHPDDHDYGPAASARRDARIERSLERDEAALGTDERELSREVWPSDDPVSRAHIGRLRISVLPLDAAVYLDGHFLGTASQIGQLSAGLVVEPGNHIVDLLRPGYSTHREEIEVPPGERAVVELELVPVGD